MRNSNRTCMLPYLPTLNADDCALYEYMVGVLEMIQSLWRRLIAYLRREWFVPQSDENVLLRRSALGLFATAPFFGVAAAKAISETGSWNNLVIGESLKGTNNYLPDPVEDYPADYPVKNNLDFAKRKLREYYALRQMERDDLSFKDLSWYSMGYYPDAKVSPTFAHFKSFSAVTKRRMTKDLRFKMHERRALINYRMMLRNYYRFGSAQDLDNDLAIESIRMQINIDTVERSSDGISQHLLALKSFSRVAVLRMQVDIDRKMLDEHYEIYKRIVSNRDTFKMMNGMTAVSMDDFDDLSLYEQRIYRNISNSLYPPSNILTNNR